jgi:amylosucrase
MRDPEWRQRHAALSLARIWPRIHDQLHSQATLAPEDWTAFEERLRAKWEQLFDLLIQLYGDQYDLLYHLEQLVAAAARSWLARPAWLKQLDGERLADPHWYQDQRMVGGVLYVDRFSGTLAGLRERIPYLRELGLTYLHLMPLLRAPARENDGGYAVSSYREVNSALGTTDELHELAHELREQGISLVLDLVFNHTSDEHEWARRTRAGDPDYQDFYYLFSDRTMPDAYERNLREIFPTVRRGSFTWSEDMGRWVWTTFNSFQWDLNYASPAVFRAMAEEMLFLANAGVEILRLDAVPFVWKRLGTNCENQPEAHLLIQALNLLARVAAPALLFKSEAIVHPDDVLSYVGVDECQISYNPLLMALLWEALATRDVKLLDHSLRHRFRLPAGCAWVTYLRSHDDIGWTFDDKDAAWEWIDAAGHRRFLNAFYTGRIPGSFARGVPFQENPDTGDARVSGTLASLAGLEAAVQQDDPRAISLAVRRILLLHSIILSIGGIPLIYLGDELGTLNDYSYAFDPARAADSRWVHRPEMDWTRAERRYDPRTVEGQVFAGLTHLIRLRKEQPALAGGAAEFVESGSPHLLAYIRAGDGQRLLVIANFADMPAELDANRLRIYGPGYHLTDLVTGQERVTPGPLRLEPYQCVWLEARG